MKVYRIENGEKIEDKDDALVAVYDSFLDKLAGMTKEARLRYFAEMCVPAGLDFDMDFGDTVILARNHFGGSSDETVMQTAERIAQKEQ